MRVPTNRPKVEREIVTACVVVGAVVLGACGGGVRIDDDDIGGVVAGPNGPEAGVWVIAETTDLPTRFNRIVVTDDAGRYVIPDLPAATYDVWVRGYGLVDSPKMQLTPGTMQDLTAVIAPDAQAAAQYYPAGHWFSLLRVPGEDEFPGTGAEGNGISENLPNQAVWLRLLKSGFCTACHSIGNEATREIPAELGAFETSILAWARRLQSGQAGRSMNVAPGFFGPRFLQEFADWTDRIAAGEVPPAPRRPQGAERNVVITQWDWADRTAYLHDEVSTDKRDPTVNAYGPIYGALEASADYVPVLDPMRHDTTAIPVPLRDETTPFAPMAGVSVLQPSPYYGDEPLWDSRTNVHNPMLDHRARLWLTSAVRPPENPAFCREGSDHPSARLFPMESANRHLAVYDPETQEMRLISTCFATHHLIFAEDEDHTLWTSGGGPVIGWLNTRMYDETGDEEASQTWAPLILDTNGNGRQDPWVEPTDSVDATMDKRINAPFYGVAYNPNDGTIWGSALGSPGGILRFDPGDNPPETALTEFFEPPWDNPDVPIQGYSPRGMDIDRNGVAWTPLASGHLASFDRSKCTGPLNGPTATGQHCPEGWTLYTEPLPQFEGAPADGSVEASYYTWVDQFNTFGLGENVPINTGNAAEGLLALVNGEWVILRVPYPLGFYTKWLDGRIDDPNGGWKGRGLWATYSTRAPFHLETGVGTTSKVVQFQLRPDPLAN